jgi:RNA polymerase-binding protein DksA
MNIELMKKKLLKLRKSLVGEIEALEEEGVKKSQKDDTGDLSGYRLHPSDVGTEEADRSTNANLLVNESEILIQVEEALYKIEKNQYGICEKCGGKINSQRLEVLPYAKFCIKCQNEDESEHPPSI